MEKVISLDKLKCGQTGVITKIEIKSPEICGRLFEMGIICGTEIKIKLKAPFGDPVCFLVKGYSLCLRKNILKDIFVSVAV